MKPSRDRHRQALQLQILTLGHAIAVYFGTSIGRIIGFSNLGSSPVATIFVRMEFAVSLTSPRVDRKSTRLNSSHSCASRTPSSVRKTQKTTSHQLTLCRH